MTLIDFIQRLLGREKPSGALARERLQLVLAHDRSDLNPELLEQMRREILEVVQKYVEIDLDSGDVSLETGDRVTALVANLPIRRARPLANPRTAGDSPAAAAEPASAATKGAEAPVELVSHGQNGASTGEQSDPDGVDAEKAAVADPGLPG